MRTTKQLALERFRQDDLKRQKLFEAIVKATEMIFSKTVMADHPEPVIMNLLVKPTGVDWNDEHQGPNAG